MKKLSYKKISEEQCYSQLQKDIEDEIKRYIDISNKKMEEWCLERSANPLDFEKRLDPRTGKWTVVYLKTGEEYTIHYTKEEIKTSKDS